MTLFRRKHKNNKRIFNTIYARMKNIKKEYEHQDYLRFVYILKKQTDNNENNFSKNITV